MNKIVVSHSQMHILGRSSFENYVVGSDVKNIKPYNSEAPIDKYFSQPHNLKGGCVDTSPGAVSTVQGAAHCSPVSAERALGKDFTDKDIHDMVISKHCQSLYETSKLAGLKPNKDMYEEISEDSSAQNVESNLE